MRVGSLWLLFHFFSAIIEVLSKDDKYSPSCNLRSRFDGSLSFIVMRISYFSFSFLAQLSKHFYKSCVHVN